MLMRGGATFAVTLRWQEIGWVEKEQPRNLQGHRPAMNWKRLNHHLHVFSLFHHGPRGCCPRKKLLLQNPQQRKGFLEESFMVKWEKDRVFCPQWPEVMIASWGWWHYALFSAASETSVLHKADGIIRILGMKKTWTQLKDSNTHTTARCGRENVGQHGSLKQVPTSTLLKICATKCVWSRRETC